MKVILIFVAVILGIIALSPAIDESINVKGENTTAVPENTIVSPTPNKPSERALKASVGVFLLLNEEEEKTLLGKYSENNDIKETIVNLAIFLDTDTARLNEIEKIIATAATTQTSQDDNYENTSPSNNSQIYYNDLGQEKDYSYKSTITDSDKEKINIIGGGSSSYTQYGNTLYGSGGDTYTKYGNTTYGSNGSTYTQYGNTVYGNSGDTYSKYGNTIYSNDGTSYSTYGNTTYGSDGSTATQYGNTIYTNP